MCAELHVTKYSLSLQEEEEEEGGVTKLRQDLHCLSVSFCSLVHRTRRSTSPPLSEARGCCPGVAEEVWLEGRAWASVWWILMAGWGGGVPGLGSVLRSASCARHGWGDGTADEATTQSLAVWVAGTAVLCPVSRAQSHTSASQQYSVL